MTDLQEEELLKNIRLGNKKSFAIIFETHWESLYLEAYYRLKDHSLAQDMVQDVFLSCWQRREELTIRVSLLSYLRGALKHHIIRHISKNRLHQDVVDHLMQRMTLIEDSIIDAISAGEMAKTIEATIAKFPENMREIILLRLQHFSVKEVSDALGLSPQTVKNNSTEAVKRLKKVLFQQHPDVSTSVYLFLLLFT